MLKGQEGECESNVPAPQRTDQRCSQTSRSSCVTLASQLPPLGFSFFICKMGMIILSVVRVIGRVRDGKVCKAFSRHIHFGVGNMVMAITAWDVCGAY